MSAGVGKFESITPVGSKLPLAPGKYLNPFRQN